MFRFRTPSTQATAIFAASSSSIVSSSSSSSFFISSSRSFHARVNTNVKTNDGGKSYTTRDFTFESPEQLSPELGGDSSLSLLARPGSKLGRGGDDDDFRFHVSSKPKTPSADPAARLAEIQQQGSGTGAAAAAAAAAMDTEDVLIRTETALRWYNPVAYAWLMLPSVDLIDIMVLKGVVPRDHPQTHIARWFAAPEDVVYYPAALKDILGQERYNVVAPEIVKLLGDYEEGVSPLVRALNKHPELPRDIWLALMRWMAVMASRAEAKDTILALTLAISNGQGPQSLRLPEMQQHRGAIVGDILIGAGAEYGAVSLAQLGVDLLLINGKSCTFHDQKTLTVAFSRTSARLMDWSVRCSGELLRCLPRWFANHVALSTVNNRGGKAEEAMAHGKRALMEQLEKEERGHASASAAASATLTDDEVEVVGGVSDLTDEEQQEIYEKMADEKDSSSMLTPEGKKRGGDAGALIKKKMQTAPGSLEELEELEAAASSSSRGGPDVDPDDAQVSLVTDTEQAREERLVNSLGAESVFYNSGSEGKDKQQQEPLMVGDPTWRYFKSSDEQKRAHGTVRKALLQQSKERKERMTSLSRKPSGRPKKTAA